MVMILHEFWTVVSVNLIMISKKNRTKNMKLADGAKE